MSHRILVNVISVSGRGFVGELNMEAERRECSFFPVYKYAHIRSSVS